MKSDKDADIAVFTDLPTRFESECVMTFIDGKCVKTELLPVSLGFYKERYKKNLPYVADEIEALAILEYLNRACRPYGVEWCYSGGIMIRSK